MAMSKGLFVHAALLLCRSSALLRPSAQTGGALGAINIRNEWSAPIVVTFDDWAPCLSANAGTARCTWASSDARFSLAPAASDGRAASARSQVVEPGQTWTIVPPKTALGGWEWCRGPGDCPGLGFSVTPGVTGTFPNGVPSGDHFRLGRVEFNPNGGDATSPTKKEMWLNLSGVDAVNAPLTVSYSACAAAPPGAPAGPATLEYQMLSGYAQCPPKSQAALGVNGAVLKSCVAPKYYGSVSNAAMAGCGTDDETVKCQCRHWWAADADATEWNAFCHRAPTDIYAWAYDEFVLDQPTDPASCATKTNPHKVLGKCPMTRDGSINVRVQSVFM